MRAFFTKILQIIWTNKRRTLIILLILGVFFYFIKPKPQVPIQTVTVKHATLQQTIGVNGTVFSKTSVDLTFATGGKVVYLGAQKGDTVKQYQTIALLDQRTVQKNLTQVLLDYAKQRNTFEQTLDNNNAQNTPPVNDTVKRILQNNQYDLEKSVNSVELQDLVKQQSILTTPIAGILTRSDIKTTGVNITPTTTFTVTDPSSMVFDMDVDEADIGKVSTGKKVAIILDPYGDITLHASISDIDFVTHTTSTGGTAYTVEVELPQNTHTPYRVGMNGNADIILAERKNVLTIPLSSIINNNIIYVKKQNTFEKRKVRIGLQNDTDAEVIHGVQEGEEVVEQPSLLSQNQKE